MTLRLGRVGRWLVAGGLSVLGSGLVAGLPVLTIMGGAMLLGLVWAAAEARVVAHALRRGDLRVHMDGAQARVRVARTLRRTVTLEGPLRHRLRGLELSAGAVAPLQAEVEPRGDGYVLSMSSPRVGHAWLHGFHVDAFVAGGLLELRGWVPHRLSLSVLPLSFPLREEAPLQATRAALQDRAGLSRARRRGFGMEIRELRDHQPGDPFKHIAWGASARRGKLISREFESDRMLSAWLVLDVSPSMYWGPPGGTRIDFAIETAWNLAHLLLARGDRVGLLLHDERVRMHVPPSSSSGQRFRILEGVQEVHHLLHEDRTEVTDRELVEAVGRWFEAQERRSFRLPGRLVRHAGPRHVAWDEARLLHAVERRLEELRGARRPGRFAIPTQAYAREPRHATYRAFCRHAGVPLPLDPTPRPGGQAHGLEQAVERILRTRGGPHTLVVISDLATADDIEALRRAALGARRHRHAVVVLCPADPAFESPPEGVDNPLAEALVEVERLRTRHGLEAVEAALRPAGVKVVPCGPRDTTPRLLLRLDQVA
ncbi:MAG: DUF58 domain-containing protein [Myxococcota bacterium]